jgi:hypothetical protein
MKTTVNRTLLLQALEAVEPGLSARATVEQSNMVIFRNGFVITYNEEICCRYKAPVPKEMQLAVCGKPLLELVRRLPDDDLTLIQTPAELQLIGSRRKGGVRLEKDILLPYGAVEKPETWKPIPEEFRSALDMACECVSKDESHFSLTCVHITPNGVEACDNFQMFRFKVRVPTEGEFLLRKDAARHASAIGATYMAETKSWVHFRNNEKLILSCRRYEEEYPVLDGEFKNFRGTSAKFPGGAAEAAEFGAVFSAENPDDDRVTVTLGEGRFTVRGDGVSGWASESTKYTKWHGPPLSFGISPKLLTSIIERRRVCEVSPKRIKTASGSWTYLACLRAVVGTNGNGQHAKKKEEENDVE